MAEGTPTTSRSPAVCATGEVGDGTCVGTGISVGERSVGSRDPAAGGLSAGKTGATSSSSIAIDVGEGARCTEITGGEEGAAPPGRLGGAMLTTSRTSPTTGEDGAGEVGCGISVGTGTSVGEDGGPGGSAASATELDAPVGASGGTRPPVDVVTPTAFRAGGGITGPSSSPTASDVGDGIFARSTEISVAVGVEGATRPAGTLTVIDSGGGCSSDGDVGDGTRVGTGISVGDEGTG